MPKLSPKMTIFREVMKIDRIMKALFYGLLYDTQVNSVSNATHYEKYECKNIVFFETTSQTNPPRLISTVAKNTLLKDCFLDL